MQPTSPRESIVDNLFNCFGRGHVLAWVRIRASTHGSFHGSQQSDAMPKGDISRNARNIEVENTTEFYVICCASYPMNSALKKQLSVTNAVFWKNRSYSPAGRSA